jgi:hypothetical protein
MTAQKHIERIRAALEAREKAHGIVATTKTWGAVAKACSPAAMSSVLAHIDAQQAEIDRLKSLADSEGSRAVEYLRRARKAEARPGAYRTIIKETP